MTAAVDAYRRLVAGLDYPMYVVTVADGAHRAGCLVGFAAQVSIDPARALLGLSEKNHTYRVAQRVDTVCLHFLAADQVGLASLFGEETGDEVDKFTRCAWSPGPAGVPVLAGCRGWVAARVLDRFAAGDHQALLVEPFAGEAERPDDPFLGFRRVRHLHPGHEP